MTARYDFAISRRVFARGLHLRFALLENRGRREDRVRAAPAVSCAIAHRKRAHEHTGSAEALRPSLRSGFTAYFVLSPVNGSFATVVPEKLASQNLTPAPRRQDHTTSPYASCALVLRALHVHRIPPRVRDDREPPLVTGETRGLITDLPSVEIRALLKGELRTLRGQLVAAIPASADRATRLHLEDSRDAIDEILDPRAMRTRAVAGAGGGGARGGFTDSLRVRFLVAFRLRKRSFSAAPNVLLAGLCDSVGRAVASNVCRNCSLFNVQLSFVIFGCAFGAASLRKKSREAQPPKTNDN